MIRQERQCEQVVEFLNKYGSMTQRDADRIGIKRLASRVCDLNQMGIGIRSERIRVTNSDGSHSYVAKYSMKGGQGSWTEIQNRLSRSALGMTHHASADLATVADTSRESSGQKKTGMITKTMQSHSMTFEWASKLVTKLLSATQEQKDSAVLYLNIWDFINLKEICQRSMLEGGKLCGVEVRAKTECPEGKYYIIRRKE